jgi:hypothetical protein
MDNMYQHGTRKGKLTEAKAYMRLYSDATNSRKSMMYRLLNWQTLSQKKKAHYIHSQRARKEGEKTLTKVL